MIRINPTVKHITLELLPKYKARKRSWCKTSVMAMERMRENTNKAIQSERKLSLCVFIILRHFKIKQRISDHQEEFLRGIYIYFFCVCVNHESHFKFDDESPVNFYYITTRNSGAQPHLHSRKTQTSLIKSPFSNPF